MTLHPPDRGLGVGHHLVVELVHRHQGRRVRLEVDQGIAGALVRGERWVRGEGWVRGDGEGRDVMNVVMKKLPVL